MTDIPEQTDETAFTHRLGDILGMALRGEITTDEAQEMANARQAVLGKLGA